MSVKQRRKYLRWNRKKASLWAWQFIRENKRLPGEDDLKLTGSPQPRFIMETFGSLQRLIDNAGPAQRSNNKPNTFIELKRNFERFNREFGHYPTASEIDTCAYFPRERSIERSWGGAPLLRKLFGLTLIDFSEGDARSMTSKRVIIRGFEVEREMEKALIEIYGEEFVHVEKRFRASDKSRLDFVIYSKTGKFGVDVFYPETLPILKVQLLIKMRQYRNVEFPLFLVYANIKINKEQVLIHLEKKISKLPPNIRVVVMSEFFLEVKEKYTPYDLKQLVTSI